MKKLITLFTVATLAFSFAVPLHAADGKKPKAEKSEKAAKAKKKRDTFPYYGAIGKVDEKAKTFTIVGKSSTRTFHVSGASKISRDGKAATLGEFKSGEQVSGACKYNKDAGEGHYSVVSMRPRPAKKKK